MGPLTFLAARFYIYRYEKSRFSGYLIGRTSGKAFDPIIDDSQTTKIFYLQEEFTHGDIALIVVSIKHLPGRLTFGPGLFYIYRYEKSKIDFLRCRPSGKAFEPTSQRFRTTEIFYLPEDCKAGENGVIVRSLRILWDL